MYSWYILGIIKKIGNSLFCQNKVNNLFIVIVWVLQFKLFLFKVKFFEIFVKNFRC